MCVCSECVWWCVRSKSSQHDSAPCICVCVWVCVCLCVCICVEAPKVVAASAGRQSVNDLYICMTPSLRLCVSTSPSPANSVVRNKRPQMMRPTGSHSTYHALRGQTVELECIVQGLWVSLCVCMCVSSASINQKNLSCFFLSILPASYPAHSPLRPPHPLFILLSILCCLLPTLLGAALSFNVFLLFSLHDSFFILLPFTLFCIFPSSFFPFLLNLFSLHWKLETSCPG